MFLDMFQGAEERKMLISCRKFSSSVQRRYVISDINAIWLRLCTTGLRDFFASSFVAFVLAEAQVLVESFSQNHS